MIARITPWAKGALTAMAAMAVFAVSLGCFIALMLLVISMEEGGGNLSSYAVSLTCAVMLLSHFLTDDYIDRVLEILDETRCEAYYYRMGAAWAVATAMAKYRDKTLAFLKTTALDDWTYNKAIQKMLESYRVSPEDKILLRAMKRK